MQFDLISDLHLDQWDNNIKDWRGLGTSLTCVVAGDVSRDHQLTVSFLKHLCDSYAHVMFVDGNHEHFRSYDRIQENVDFLDKKLGNLKNLTFLADASLVIEDTAFIGSNGWWTFDFPELAGASNRIQCMEEFCQRENWTMKDAVSIWTAAQEQSEFLGNVVENLQMNDDITEIVVITHTVPRMDLGRVDPAYGDYGWSKMGNSSMKDILNFDVEGKISTWCYGHNHVSPLDQTIDGVRYISHPRGRHFDSMIPVYYPKRIDTVHDLIRSPDQ